MSKHLLDALNKIAAWNDELANESLVNTGSYRAFDEPASVQIAREALAASSQPQAQEAEPRYSYDPTGPEAGSGFREREAEPSPVAQPVADVWRKSLDAMASWTRAALNCKAWDWDGDQREVAMFELAQAEALLASPPRTEEGVEAWECKDYADGWIRFAVLAEALVYQEGTGCIMRPVRALSPKEHG